MAARVVHVEVRGLDTPRLQEFYERVFGWSRDESLSIDDYSVTDVSGGPLTAGVGPVPDWSAHSAKFYVQVDDIDQTLERVEQAGGAAVMPRTEGPRFGTEHILVFTSFVDPAGNVIGLVETPKPG